MSKPKKKEYRLSHCGIGYYLESWDAGYGWWLDIDEIRERKWHAYFAPPKSPLRLRIDHKIKISITPTKTGFTIKAIGKPEKI